MYLPIMCMSSHTLFVVLGFRVVKTLFFKEVSLDGNRKPSRSAGPFSVMPRSKYEDLHPLICFDPGRSQPLWVLKTVKETRPQRLVHLSADLARQIGMMLDNVQHGWGCHDRKGIYTYGDLERPRTFHSYHFTPDMYACQAPIKPLTPPTLLDSICWSISEPSSSASIYTDSEEAKTSINEDGKESDASFVNSSRPLSEFEKNEFVFKNHFLTILFPVDRFSEMGPSSKTFFSDSGFTCLQLLNNIYAFYQENMSRMEIELAIHTDSRHADRLRSVYASKEAAEIGYVEIKRIEFLGSRKSFEMLKRVPGENNSNNAASVNDMENMSRMEIELAIHTDSRHADRLRSVYASKEAAEIGYVEIKRIEFLGSRKCFEMLKRVPGENNSNVYELLTRA
ncbi:hypothetical protein Tco_1546523 [Tanacetum coccineum]